MLLFLTSRSDPHPETAILQTIKKADRITRLVRTEFISFPPSSHRPAGLHIRDSFENESRRDFSYSLCDYVLVRFYRLIFRFGLTYNDVFCIVNYFYLTAGIGPLCGKRVSYFAL
jgi:hypothetical protein